MKVAKAKRRLLKWKRYVERTGSSSANRNLAGYHNGHTKAYMNYQNANYAPPLGIRVVWYGYSKRGRHSRWVSQWP